MEKLVFIVSHFHLPLKLSVNSSHLLHIRSSLTSNHILFSKILTWSNSSMHECIYIFILSTDTNPENICTHSETQTIYHDKYPHALPPYIKLTVRSNNWRLRYSIRKRNIDIENLLCRQFFFLLFSFRNNFRSLAGAGILYRAGKTDS